MLDVLSDHLKVAGLAAGTLLQLEARTGIRWFAFGESSSPIAVISLCRTAEHIAEAREEFAALTVLEPHAAVLGAPRPLFQFYRGDALVSARTGIPGLPLRGELKSKSADAFEKQLRIVGNWLTVFQTTVVKSGTVRDRVNELSEALRGRDPLPNAAEIAILERSHEFLDRMSSIPATAVHGDLWPGNVLTDRHETFVLDWNTFHYGSPLEDVFGYVTGAYLCNRNEPAHNAMTMWPSLFGCTHGAELASDWASRVLRSQQLSNDTLEPLFLVFLLDRLTRTRFKSFPAWQAFVEHYVTAGVPPLWSGAI